MITRAVLLLSCIVGAMILVLLAVAVVWDIRLLFDRRMLRFRLRTLLLFGALLQAALAFGTWWHQRDMDVGYNFAALGLGAFGIWGLWRILEDVFGTPTLRRIRSQIRPKHMVEPPTPKEIEPPPREPS